MTTPRSTALFIFVALLAVPRAASAQIRASERATISQTVDGTLISVDFARPRVRDRHPVFGGFVHWGEVWTPGANWATTFEFSKDVTVNGHPVKAGKYSVWFVVQPDEWNVVLDPNPKQFHMPAPPVTDDKLQFKVHPKKGPFTEALTFSVPQIRADGLTLQFNWETASIPFDIKVEPTHEITIAGGEAAPYLGSYTMKPTDPAFGPEATMRLAYEDGGLYMYWEPAPWPEMGRTVLIRIADDWFVPGLFFDGALYEVISEMVFEFDVEHGMAKGFELRGEGDLLWATATRKH